MATDQAPVTDFLTGAHVANSVELRGLTKTYAGQSEPTLERLDLEVRDGEFFSLLGPSGSGKTTTLRLVAGFERADAGSILLDGADVTNVPPHRRDINTVFQNYALFPHMTVGRNVEYPLRVKQRGDRGEVRRLTREALEMVGMDSFATRLPHELSGGQRQRVALARALVSRPKVVLLDEPLGALDLQLRHKMQVVLKDLQSQLGVTFIYVTHDQGEALAMSDRIAVMNEGRIEQCSSPEDIYANPGTRFVASFIGKSNLLDCTIKSSGELTWAGVPLVLGDPSGAGSTVVVRTERVQIVPPGGAIPSINHVEARVHQKVYLGDACEVVLKVGDLELVAKAGVSEAAHCVPGQNVHVHIAPEDLRRVDG